MLRATRASTSHNALMIGEDAKLLLPNIELRILA